MGTGPMSGGGNLMGGDRLSMGWGGPRRSYGGGDRASGGSILGGEPRASGGSILGGGERASGCGMWRAG